MPTLDPRDFDGAVFDLDGVVTRTADVHAAAWKEMFDEFLRQRADREGEAVEPFDAQADYLRYVDGKPRYEGVASFLASRGIELPRGDPSDPPERETVCGLGNRKNERFRKVLERDGVEVFRTSVDLVRELKRRGVRVALMTSSRNGADVLRAAGLEDLFEARVDGEVAAELGLAGKPAPDCFLEAARRIGADPARSFIVEDALSGVEAGRRGGFALVIGVDRAGQADELRRHGAQLVVRDLGEIELAPLERDSSELPSALEELEAIAARLLEGEPAVFLDYDGTLTPIVQRPEDAVVSAEMRARVERLARVSFLALVSGRDRRDVRRLAGIEGAVYAGSHGFDIAGPPGSGFDHEVAAEFLDSLDAAEAELGERLEGIEGAQIERKRFMIAVHYRRVARPRVAGVEAAVDEVLARHRDLRKEGGKEVFELQPDIEWDKGRAVRWLLERLPGAVPLYAGDDRTDETVFRSLPPGGIGIFVADVDRPTAASWVLRGVGEVGTFLEQLAERLERRGR